MGRKIIFTIGSAMKDIFIECACRTITPHEEPCEPCIIFQEGAKVTVDKLSYAIGGGALNTAISFTRLGVDSYPIVKLGSDSEADYLIKKLLVEKIHIDYVLHDKNVPTGTSFIIPSPNGNRAALVYRGASTHINFEDIPYETMKHAAGLYIASLNGQAAKLLPELAHFAQKNNIPLLVNPGTSQLTTDSATLVAALPDIPMLILNAHEAHLLMQQLNAAQSRHRALNKANKDSPPTLLHAPLTPESPYYLTDFFKAMLARGPKIVVVTNGKEGVYATDGTKIFFHRAIPTTVVSTIGAGDAFGSAFFVQHLEYVSVIDALCAGALNSAAALTSVGATTSVLTKDELEKKLKACDKKLFEIYDLGE